jgi:hypothetical protein
MLRVTVDIFSGRPNPSWVLDEAKARDALHQISLTRGAIGREVEIPPLGYRGVTIETLTDQLAADYGLPHRFHLANRSSDNEARGIELASKLVSEALGEIKGTRKKLLAAVPGTDEPGLGKFLIEQIEGRVLGSSPHMLVFEAGPPTAKPAASPVTCAIETLPFQPAYWNDPAHVTRNNCYAYATNMRTDTFPQPGKATGHQVPFPPDCKTTAAGAISDGAHEGNDCFPADEAPRMVVAMVIWPKRDYHWYRLHTEGFWGHKPSGTPARNVDQSGNVITNPQTCNRGQYTEFCGYFLIPKSIKVQ